MVSPAFAQRELHLYGGPIVGGEEYTKGYVVGSGVQAGSFLYIGTETHLPQLTDEGKQLIEEAIDGVVTKDFVYGVDLVIGAATLGSERVSVIPVGLIGFTTGEACVQQYETVNVYGYRTAPFSGRRIYGVVDRYRSLGDEMCEKTTETNVGAGLTTTIRGSRGHGVQVGFRYTRHYGYAVAGGAVFNLD